MRLGLQYGTGINFGFGALDTPGERKRASLSGSIEPRLGAKFALDRSELYGGVSVAAAATTLDGEISGAFARSGDTAVNTDEAFMGWRNQTLDFSVGAQDFTVGDGLLIADGNFDTGANDGNYWVVPFSAWRNSAILRVNTGALRGEAFWLRSDRDFGDSRIAGINVETNAHKELGTLGAMYFEIFDAKQFNLNGLEVWDVRMSDVRVPGVENIYLFGEFVRQGGRDKEAARDNDAYGWYLEGQYRFQTLPWTPTFAFRYSHFSGDDLATPENEEYRTLFYTFYKREWDTWYQGEIASEYHLFNRNQITKMFKLKLVPRPDWVVSLYYYRHDLDSPQYLGTPVTDTAWADEVNLGVERFIGHAFYGYVGIAWSTPDTAAQQIFGHDDDFTVIQTWLSYTF